ncbi:Phosphocarrier protein HPr [bioreactor metagenome]|uniref:Phosphocarrier protein HPr n=1 Tax=bioreactor metagenome TaxID=1076179 RepID=A0A645EPR9_9ZZZZ
MYRKTTTVITPTGLHARPAAEFVAAAKKFQSTITIRTVDDSDAVPMNAKSIVMLLSLGACQNTKVEISASGSDETEAVDSLVALIDSDFGELSNSNISH